MSDRTPRFVIAGLMVYDGDRAPLNDRPTPEIEKFEKYVPAWAHAHTPSRAAQTAVRRAAVARGAPSRVRPRARPPVTMEPTASTAPWRTSAVVTARPAFAVVPHAVLDKPASEIRAPPPRRARARPPPRTRGGLAGDAHSPLSRRAQARGARPSEPSPSPSPAPSPRRSPSGKITSSASSRSCTSSASRASSTGPSSRASSTAPWSRALSRTSARRFEIYARTASTAPPWCPTSRCSQIFDTAENHADGAETEPIEFSESDDSEDDSG